jgi:porin
MLIALCAPAFAAEDAAPGYSDDTLTGDWNGLRNDWYRHGVAVDLGYKLDTLRVTDGGKKKGGQPIGHFDLRVKGDMEKLIGWTGATGFVNYVYDSGGKTNNDYVGSLLGTSGIEVPVTTARFYQAWIEQSLADDKVTVLAGLYPIDTEFQAVESAGLFVQPPYGAAPDIALTRSPSTFNNPALGVRVKWQSKDLGLYAMGAVLDGVPGDPDQPKGTHIRFQRGDGVMQIAEIGYRLTAVSAAPAAEAKDAQEAGAKDEKAAEVQESIEAFEKYALGYWRYTAKVDDLLVDVDGINDSERRRRSGWYALAERTLLRWGTGNNLTGFVRFGATDGDSTAIEQFYNAGARVRGLLPGREDDVFGLAHTHADIGDKFRVRQAVNNGITATAVESATEMTYRVQVNKWLAVQPVIQWYRNPGADSAVPNATVVGVRVELAL